MEVIGDAPQPNLTPADYTIGWICTKGIEYDAAQLFLDETHPNIAPSTGNHHYTLGKIGEHNVVIAAMANRDCEEATAAVFVRNMRHVFPYIMYNLMVGIGSGAPSSEHDIRLGDVVVSVPHYDSESPAFLQYDFDKAIQDGTLHKAARCVNEPPPPLVNASGLLISTYTLDGHQINEAISSILEKEPMLMQKYARPQSSSDKLYKSTINQEDCIISHRNDVSMLIQRPERPQHEDNEPHIHRGSIAWGSQAMKDAIIRDKLISQNERIVCFETKPFGTIMATVPCLIVRGICDYSDSHKNEEWQGYAAMTAAAYTKDLLNEIIPQKKTHTRT